MKTLTCNLTTVWFNQFVDGEKLVEYRQRTPFWKKRLHGLSYDLVKLCLGYPKNGDTDRIRWADFVEIKEETITHPHFGNIPTDVYAVYVKNVRKAI